MDKNKYYGEYRASVGCQKTWISAGQESSNIPPQVSYACDICNNTHNFRLTRTYMLATPGQKKQFETYCKTHGLETEIKLSR